MPSLSDDLLSQLAGPAMQQIGQQLGTSHEQTAGAVSAALPMILGAIGRNAAQPGGAEALLGALGRDHASAGGIGDILGSVLGGQQSAQTNAAGQLGHIFGGNLSRVETGLGQATGLGGDKAQMLLKILAPVVMGFLAKRGLGDASALGNLLGQEHAQATGAGGLLGGLLDQDGDGKMGLGDALKLGGSLFGGR